jgi:hypothetical protein
MKLKPISRHTSGRVEPRHFGIILIVMEETEIIFSVQESPEGGYEARALGYSIFTQADTMDELKLNVARGGPLPLR